MMDNVRTVSASFHVGDEVQQGHNRRDPKITSHEAHIDPNGYHKTIIDRDIRDVYSEIFDQAVEEYNAKQTRADRKIDSYYEKIAEPFEKAKAEQKKAIEYNTQNREAIKAGTVKRMEIPKIPNNIRKPCYEIIVGGYLAEYRVDEDGEIIRDPKTDAPIIDHPERTPRELSEPICDEYLEGFIKRNPNLRIVGSYFHDDEPNGASGHLHLDFVPFHTKNKRGLSVQHGMEAALKEMGLTPQEWIKQENDALEAILESHGLTVIRSKGAEHKNKKELDAYNKQRDRELEAEKLKREIETLQQDAMNAERARRDLKQDIADYAAKLAEMTAEFEAERDASPSIKIKRALRAMKHTTTKNGCPTIDYFAKIYERNKSIPRIQEDIEAAELRRAYLPTILSDDEDEDEQELLH